MSECYQRKTSCGIQAGREESSLGATAYVGTENCLNKSLGPEEPQVCRGGSWAGRRVVQHALHWVLGSHLYGLIVKCGTVNVIKSSPM